jgi:putative solute:sodium symporter small subunit
MGAQGALIVYVIILYYYAKKMRSYDVQYGVDEGEE